MWHGSAAAVLPGLSDLLRSFACGSGWSIALVFGLILAGNPSVLRAQDSTRSQFFTRPESPPADEPPPSGLREPPTGPVSSLHDNPQAQPAAAQTVSAGPFAFKVGLMGAIEYNSNVRVEQVAQEGVMASLGVNLEGALRISSRQELNFVAVINQRTPLSGPGKSERLLSVAPNSVLRFQVWVRSLRLTPFLKYSRQLDPVLSPVVNNTRILDQAAFTKGIQADLPLSSGGIQLIGVHDRRSQRGDVALSQTAWTKSAGLRGIYNASAAHTLSADFVLARTRYIGGPSDRVKSRSVSVSDEWKMADQKSLTAVYGYGEQSFQNPRTEGDTLRNGSAFMSLNFRHALRENLKLNWRFGRSTQEGVATNFYKLSEVGLTPEYKFAERLNTSFTFGHQWVAESGPLGEDATRLAMNLTVSYALAAKSDVRLMIDRAEKESSVVSRGYQQLRVTLMANHQF